MKRSISIATSLYKSAPYVTEFYNRCKIILDQLGCNYEFVFVLDGITDDASAVVQKLIKEDSNIKLIELSRNFGHQFAMLAAIENASMDLVFAIDVDLEEPPECLERFYDLITKNWDNMDAVVGVHESRESGSAARLSGKLFYKIFNVLAEENIQENQLWARIMKKEYVAAFLRHKENMRFSAGLFAITGFKQVYVPVKKNYKGESSYSMLDRLTSGIDAITSFSVKPLKYLFFLGLFSFILSSIAGVALVFSKLYIDYFSGWLSTITLVILFGSINLMALGVVGIYISRIYLEAKDRPKYHIRRIYGKS